MGYISLIGLVNDNYIENRTLRVRILHIHGLPDNLANSRTRFQSRTKDEDLPIIPHEIPSIIPTTDYDPGAVVRIICPTGRLSSARVTGVIRTSEEMREVNPVLCDALQPIPNIEITLGLINSAVTEDQTTIIGQEGVGLADAYIEKYKTVFGYPFESWWRISSDYEYRVLGDGTPGKFHQGVDLAATQGTPIYAVGDGTVVAAFGNWNKSCGIDNMMSYGNYVTIDHGVCSIDNIHYYSHYAHMKSICVKVGDTVKGTQLTQQSERQQATQIGVVGHTGHCYPDNEDGSHLHFEILHDITRHNKETTFDPKTRIYFANPETRSQKDDNAILLWALGRLYGMNDYQCAAMIGNINHESQNIDPTSVEGIYDEPFQTPEEGTKKKPLFNGNKVTATMYTFTQSLFARYASQGLAINQNGYKFFSGQYVAGFGLIGYTGTNAENLLNYATKNNLDWYDFKIQSAFMMYGFGSQISIFLADSSHANSVKDATASWAGIVEYGGEKADYNALGFSSRYAYAQYWYDRLHPNSDAIFEANREWAESVKEIVDNS